MPTNSAWFREHPTEHGEGSTFLTTGTAKCATETKPQGKPKPLQRLKYEWKKKINPESRAWFAGSLLGSEQAEPRAPWTQQEPCPCTQEAYS